MRLDATCRVANFEEWHSSGLSTVAGALENPSPCTVEAWVVFWLRDVVGNAREGGREGYTPLRSPPSPGTTWKRGRNNGRSEVRRGCSRSGHCWPTCSLEQTRLIDFVQEHMGTSTATLSSPSPSLSFFLPFFSLLRFESSTFVPLTSTVVSLTSNLIVTVFTTGFSRVFHSLSRTNTPIPSWMGSILSTSNLES